jgi:hypothetical protein
MSVHLGSLDCLIDFFFATPPSVICSALIKGRHDERQASATFREHAEDGAPKSECKRV